MVFKETQGPASGFYISHENLVRSTGTRPMRNCGSRNEAAATGKRSSYSLRGRKPGTPARGCPSDVDSAGPVSVPYRLWEEGVPACPRRCRS